MQFFMILKDIVRAVSLQFAVVLAIFLQPQLGLGQERPSIILIMADDLGVGDVSCYGSKTIVTPGFDRLAKEGLRFTQAYATAATCTPSRYSLLTGRYPFRNHKAQVLPGDAPLLIDPERPTLPAALRERGYVTGVVGKWHLGLGLGDVDWNKHISPGANEVGFDYSFLLPATNDRVPNVYVENGRVQGLLSLDPLEVNYNQNYPGEPTGKDHPHLLKMLPSHGHDMSINNGISRIGYQRGGKTAQWIDENMADTFLERSLQFVRTHRRQPFFLFYSLHQPHVPRLPHPRFAGKSGMGPRGDVILEADWCVSEFLKELDKLGLTQKCLIIFTSDNGPVLDDGYEDEAVTKAGKHDPRAGLRGGKYSLFDGGTHVPFLLRWPGRVKPGTSPALISQHDLAMSLLALVGGNYAEPDGQNVLPALLGRSSKGREELALMGAGQKVILRHKNWVYLPAYPGQAVAPFVNIELGHADQPMLFNLKSDFRQQNNIAHKNPARVKRMQTRLAEISGTKL